ncbi:MAG: hypothetical protein ACRED4_03000, partial [Brevundimonas sp.]
MPVTTTIEIDFDVHKTIETNRTSFAETPNDVLKRLLAIAPPNLQKELIGKPYTYQSLALPHGSE